MTSGDRLKEERERLGLSQTSLGEACGVTKKSQINYEKGERSPDALYLSAFHRAGGDVMYVLTGDRTAPALLPPDETLLLNRYRASPRDLRDAALRVLLGGDVPASVTPKKSKQTAKVKQAGDRNVFQQSQGGANADATRSGRKSRTKW